MHLKNGLEVIYIPAKTFYNTVVIGSKSGYSYDPDDEIGLNHLYEHVFVAMLSRLYKYSEKIEKYGFSQNAFTYNSAIVFFFEQYRKNIYKILKIMKKQIEKFMVDNKDFEIEKSSVENETSEWNKDKDGIIFNIVKQKGFSLARNKRVDKLKNVKKLSMFSVIRENNNIFSKNNVVVVLYGKLSKKEYRKIIKLLASIELGDKIENKNYHYDKYSQRMNRDTGVIIYNLKSPTFDDYICERIYKNVMVDYDDSLLFDFVRNKEKMSYGAKYDEIDGVDERVFYFSFTFKDKTKLKEVMNKIGNVFKTFKQNKDLFEKGKKRTIVEFYKDSLNQTDFAIDLAYYYLIYGEKLNINEIIKRVSKISYNHYKNWLKRLKVKKVII